MKAKLFVDGNNCLHALFPDLPLEVARERLQNFLIKLANEKDLQIKVFFDQPFPERQIKNLGGIELSFPRAGESADKLIEQEILKLSGENYSYLVTSDRSLRDIALLKKVICLNPAQLLGFISDKKEKNHRETISYKIADRISKESWEKLQALKKKGKI